MIILDVSGTSMGVLVAIELLQDGQRPKEMHYRGPGFLKASKTVGLCNAFPLQLTILREFYDHQDTQACTGDMQNDHLGVGGRLSHLRPHLSVKSQALS